MQNIAAVSIKIDDSHKAMLYPSGTNPSMCKRHESIDGFDFFIDDNLSNKIYFEYKDSELNISSLRLKETIRYCCKVEKRSDELLPHIFNEDNKLVKIEKEDDRIIFQFINYLGKSSIYFGTDKTKRIDFEVVPDKINYEEDYVKLTESIADECSALLLDYTSPTSLTFQQDSSKNSNILEQFIFLRTFCFADNLENFFASIKRNPDRLLVREEEMKPFGTGIPSNKFFSNPFGHGRSWMYTDSGNFLPGEISVVHKYDSFDTAANRFIKFALNLFREICQQVLDKLSIDKNGKEYASETKSVIQQIDYILNDSFFDDIYELEMMPVNNQVLEKREGYSQIFNAFSMVDLALSLDWKGKDNIYSGEAKNTALLYEYWLFFELRKILIELAGKDCGEIETYNRFINDTNGLTISLQQGNTSVQTYKFEKENITVKLYYNRTFSPSQFSSSIYWGSYSRPFRPDYTLAVFPSKYKKEIDAIKSGDVSYVHFDAKYRIQDLTQFINSNKHLVTDETIDKPDLSISKEESEELIQEKNEENVNTYKRGDLLKMHTYNDAIRKTVGSYVLYPGSDNSTKSNEQSSVYDEILPGVGAFAIRPGNENSGHKAIREFVQKIIEFKSKESSRQYRKEYFENMVIQSPSEKSENIQIDKSDDYQMIGFIRTEYLDFLKANNLIPNTKEDLNKKSDWFIYFYFYAIKGGKVYTIHKETSKAKFLRLTDTDINNCKDEYGYKFQHLLPWEAEIDSFELVSKETLKERLDSLYKEKSFEPRNGFHADYYYLVKANIKSFSDQGLTSFIGSENDDISIYSPKIFIRILDK